MEPMSTMSTKDKVKAACLIIIIIVSFSWTIGILTKAPIVNQITTGTAAIQSGLPAEDKSAITD